MAYLYRPINRNMRPVGVSDKDPAKKGVYMGNCMREACQLPGATHYSLYRRAFYCDNCAMLINRANEVDTLREYGRRHAVFDVAFYNDGEPMPDGTIIGIHTNGRIIQWNAEHKEGYTCGETVEEFGLDNLTERERDIFRPYFDRSR